MKGIHAIIDYSGKISHYSSGQLKDLMERAAREAGATIIGSNVHEFGEGFGNTGVVLLAESHISVHTWPEIDYSAFDIFMCGEIDVERAVSVLRNEDPDGDFSVQSILRIPKKSHQKQS